MGKEAKGANFRQESGASRKLERTPEKTFEGALLALAAWFERNRRVLPWRDDPSVYRVWVSEIMLQQTQVATVVPYFEKFLAHFPTVESLAAASEEDVMLHWAGLGYYSRARNLRKGAQAIVASGRFPANREEWLEIPGVGDYTAGAILSISSDQVESILDGNVERVLSRVRRVSRGRGDAAYKARLWRLSRAFVGRAHALGVRPSVLNQALMELGATTCVPRKPLCVFCPLAGACRARMAGEQEAYPPRKKPKEWVAVREELHCVLGAGRVLVQQRTKGEWRAGLWDLPGDAPVRGKWGSLKVEPVGSIETRHVVTRHKVTRVTHVWRVAETRPRVLQAADAGAAGMRWISMDQPEVAVGSALKRTLQEIRERFEV